MPTKTLVCLANSKKLGHRCVAGVEQDTGTWVRPIGSGDHGEVTLAEQQLAGGGHPQLLDVIEVPLAAPVPQPGQPENWSLAPGQWTKVGHVGADDARQLLTRLATNDPLFGTNAKSIPASRVQAGEVTHSLAVVQPHDLNWEKRTKFGGGTQVRGQFTHSGVWLDLPLTDLAFLSYFAAAELGDYDHSGDGVFLVISLGEPLEDEHYKLIAGVVELAP